MGISWLIGWNIGCVDLLTRHKQLHSASKVDPFTRKPQQYLDLKMGISVEKKKSLVSYITNLTGIWRNVNLWLTCCAVNSSVKKQFDMTGKGNSLYLLNKRPVPASLSNWQVKFQFDWTEKEQQEVNASLHLIYLHDWGAVVWSLSNYF